MEYYNIKCYNYPMKITFLGAGAYGTALGEVAKWNDHEVKFYDPIKFPKIKLEDAVADAEAIVYVAPAEAYKRILPKLPKETPLILASKGFISMKPFEKFKNFSVLSGAAFAEDIMYARNHGKDEFPIRLTATSELTEQLFTTDFLVMEYAEDTKGVMLCGALKNVYAIGAGLLMLDEYPEIYLEEAYHEMQEVLYNNKCDPDTVEFSCGGADLIISCTPRGRNFRYGREIQECLGDKVEPAGTVEGVSVIRSIDNFPDFRWPEDYEYSDALKEYDPRRLYDERRYLIVRIIEVVKYAAE